MSKATSFSNDILDASYQNGASGTFVLGATTYTLPLKLLFLNTLSTASTQGTEWTTAAGYTHSAAGTTGGVALNGKFGTAAAAASKANDAVISVVNAPAGTWADNEIVDSSAGANKRLNFKGTPTLGKTVNLGDTCSIAIGALSGTEV